MRASAPAPVLALHGLGSCSFDVEEIGVRLGAHTFTPDVRAHGGNPCGGPLTFESLAADVCERAKHTGVERFSLLGISMGAAIALTIASIVPERVDRVLMVAPSWLPDGDRPHLEKLRKLGRIIRDRGLEQAWRIVASTPPVDNWSTEDVEAYRRRFFAFDREAVARAMLELPGADPTIKPQTYRQHGIRCHVLAWADDPIHPVPLALELAAMLGVDQPQVAVRPRTRTQEAALVAATWRRLAASAEHVPLR
jgi:pimeloyl-ACP methyl ester carboxylesterase